MKNIKLNLVIYFIRVTYLGKSIVYKSEDVVPIDGFHISLEDSVLLVDNLLNRVLIENDPRG